MKKVFCSKTLFALALGILIAVGSASAAAPWKFAVMSDTQWISQTSGVVTDDSRAPNSTPVDIIKALNQQFINNGVQFVVQVGDLCDNGSINGEDARALFAQDLYNHGIGFFPFRGNHDSSQAAGIEFKRIYPQSQTGGMNKTPSDIFNTTVAGTVQTIPTLSGQLFSMGSNFSSPTNVAGTTDPNSLVGLTYSFDYNNVRFVLLDGQVAAGIDGKTPGIDAQQAWITDRLQHRDAGSHAVVMSHRGLITENHVDVLFGNYPYTDPAGQNAFFSSLYNNGVRYYINGHDHMHDRSRINSPDGASYVNQLLCASDSSKFYTPGTTANDIVYNTPANGMTGPRQTQLAQELYTIGYYVFTVDGPKVTVDYYSAPTANVANNCSGSKCEHLITNTNPATFNPQFVKAETFGYSLNGKEILVAQGAPYTTVSDAYKGTTAAILSGTNGSTLKDYSTRSLSKSVDTGWADKVPGLNSDILTLWGMYDLYAPNTDTFVLSVSYDPNSVTPAQAQAGMVGLVSKNSSGAWVNAVNGNSGGTSSFVAGPWNASYGLGTYGIDTASNTAWAVINHNSDFAVASFVGITQGSGFVYNRATHLYTGTLTVTNNNQTAVNGVALSSLTNGVTLVNATGSNQSGDPIITFSQPLNPGVAMNVPLQFSDPSNAKINFTPVTF